MKKVRVSNLSSEETKYSKFLALILRHNPSVAGITLDKNGWANVNEVIQGFRRTGRQLTIEKLNNIVEFNNKGRYEFSKDKTRIRARQGHSIDVDVELQEVKPPKHIYHGTAEKNLKLILKDGLKPMSRKHIHLSSDRKTAEDVGRRHGKPIVLEIDTEALYNSGIKFYLSRNNVWLCDCESIKAEYISYN